jgi:hypothetical protein
MSALTDTLNYVLDRHTAINPDFASNLLPGLPHEKIVEMMKDIVDRVPEELIDLYEWHNGGGSYYSFLPCFEFNPLEHAIERRISRYHINNDNWLLIMDCNGDAQLIIMMFGENFDRNPIYCRDLECGIYEQCFDSLTTMIQSIAACFDDLYWCKEETRRIEGRNYDRYCQIHKQYNPNSTPLHKMYF